jgi:hypothetical protein
VELTAYRSELRVDNSELRVWGLKLTDMDLGLKSLLCREQNLGLEL